MTELPAEWHSGRMPPGTSPPRDLSVRFKCVNEACPNEGTTWESDAVSEFGGVYLLDENDSSCRVCGEEGKEV